jgi:hydrogenase assembly chaperone HypC/HupF
MQVLESDGFRALCRDGLDAGRREHVDLRLVGGQPPGAWLLVFLGAAREVIDELRAKQTLDALAALQAVQQGAPIEHLFADLIGREPELPEFLRT